MTLSWLVAGTCALQKGCDTRLWVHSLLRGTLGGFCRPPPLSLCGSGLREGEAGKGDARNCTGGFAVVWLGSHTVW